MCSGTYSEGAYPAAGYDFADAFVATITDSVREEGKPLHAYGCYVECVCRPRVAGSTRLTICSARLSAREAHALYFGPGKTRRLEVLKRKWDPARVFDYPHAF